MRGRAEVPRSVERKAGGSRAERRGTCNIPRTARCSRCGGEGLRVLSQADRIIFRRFIRGRALQRFACGALGAVRSWRTAALVSTIGLVTCNAACIVLHDFWVFSLLQGLSGFFGGSLASLSMTALSDSRDHDRNFAFAFAVQVLFQVGGMLAAPVLAAHGGMSAVLVALIAVDLIGLCMVPLLPGNRRALEQGKFSQAILAGPTLCALTGCLLFFLNVGCFWTYIEPIGAGSGFDPARIGTGLAIGVAAGIPGALLASVVGIRVGRLAPLVLAGLMTVLSVFLLRGTPGFGQYVAAVALYNFAWNNALVYQFSVVNAVDRTGRSVAVAPAFYSAGSAVGPGIAAFFVDANSYDVVLALVAGSVALSTIFFIAAIGLHRRAIGAIAPA